MKFHIVEIIFFWCIGVAEHYGSDCALVQPLIVGGTPATNATQFPYQISLRRLNSHICGGSIVSRNYVLTAAHCVTQDNVTPPTAFPASELSVRIGSTTRTSGGNVIAISTVFFHAQYAFPLNDIALLRVATTINYATNIRAIPLATGTLTAGTVLIASGWGFTSTNGALPSQLQYVELTYMSNAQCNQVYGPITPSLMCLKAPKGQGICQGDSGGPAAYNGKLYGVASFTPETCGAGIYPDGFANVYNYLTWITQNSDVTV